MALSRLPSTCTASLATRTSRSKSTGGVRERSMMYAKRSASREAAPNLERELRLVAAAVGEPFAKSLLVQSLGATAV